ncbi:hypothetical protein FS749_004636, partial [Ceratobasidium sp. UAMH 11750]
ATINCTMEGHVELTATTGSIVRYSASEVNNRVTPVAGNISRLINGFNADVFNDLLFGGRTSIQDGGQVKHLTAMYHTFLMDTNGNITWMHGSLTFPGWLLQDPRQGGFREHIR